MTDQARLRRMRLFARMAADQHRKEAADLFAQAGNELRARALAERTGSLLASYSRRDDAACGAELAAIAAISSRMRGINAEACAGADTAARAVEAHQSREQAARRRRDKAGERVTEMARALREREFRAVPAAGGRSGTKLDEWEG